MSANGWWEGVKEWMKKAGEYEVISFIAIGLALVIGYSQSKTLQRLQALTSNQLEVVQKIQALSYIQLATARAVEVLKAEQVLQPVVVFSLVADENKEEPQAKGDVEWIPEPYGDEGFSATWTKKEKESLVLEWQLNRKNYRDKDRYFLYFEAKADKKTEIAIALVDSLGRYTSQYIQIGDQPTPKIISFHSFDEYYEEVPDPDNPGEMKEIPARGPFNWDSVELVHIGPLYEDRSDFRLYCEKMLFLFAK